MWPSYFEFNKNTISQSRIMSSKTPDGVFQDETGKQLLQMFSEMGSTLNNIAADLSGVTEGT